MIQFYDLAGARDDQRLSPYCWRTRLALEHKGLSYDAIAWRFTEKDLIAFTGQGACPVIVDNGKAVHDSWAIMEYLEATYPAHPFFDSPQAKAHALFIKHWTEQVLHVGLTKQVVLDVHDMLADRDKPHFRSTREQRLGMTLEAFSADRDAVLPAFRAALSPLRTTLQKIPFVSGERPSYADYIVFGGFQWARVSSERDVLEPSDPIYAWRELMLGLFGGLPAKTPARGAVFAK